MMMRITMTTTTMVIMMMMSTIVFQSKQWVDGSASLAIGETFAGRVVKVEKRDENNVFDDNDDADHDDENFLYDDNDDVDDDQHGGQCADDDDAGAPGGRAGGQGGEGGYQQVLEGDGRGEQ